MLIFPPYSLKHCRENKKAGNVDRESLVMGNSLEILAEELPVEELIPLFIRKILVVLAAILEQQGLKCLVQLAKLQKLFMKNMEFRY